VGRGPPEPRALRDHRPRPEPRPVDAAHAVQRDLGRDEGDSEALPRERPLHLHPEQFDPHQPAAVHHRGAAGGGLRDHRPRARDLGPGSHRLDARCGPMTAATATAPLVGVPPSVPGRRRLALAWLVIVLALVVVWEGAKWLFGDPWRIHASLLGLPIDIEHVPPFQNRIATDSSLPHIWN